MEIKFKLLTWDIEADRISSQDFEKENDVIQTAQALSNRRTCPHDIISILKTKKTGHRWDLAIWDTDKIQNIEYISFYSKKDAKFAIKKIREYDDTLKIKLIKLY